MKNDLTSMESSEELIGLIDAWCNGQASAEEVCRLEALLLESPEARRCYRRHLNLHAELHLRSEGEEASTTVVPLPAARRRNWSAWSGWAAAAAVTLLFVVLNLLDKPWNQPIEAPVSGVESHDSTIGLLVNESAARFEGMAGKLPILFESGEYVLEEGIVHFRLTNGVDVVMRGPARFDIRDAMHMTLQSGVVRAIVPDSGHGFTIAAPEMLYQDLGTEFGLAVGKGKSEVYVFDGQVNARKPGEGRKVSSVFAGESLRQEGEQVTVDRSGSDVKFPSPEDVGYEGWLGQQPSITVPDGLIAYFPFMHDPVRPEVLRNIVTLPDGRKVVPDAMIKGARWVSGRWSEKDALLFDRDGDRVELEIPGEFDEISMSVWIDIDRLDHAVNSIFTSNGWEPGDLHWQVLRTQDPILAVYKIDESGSLLKQPIRLGRWIHLTAVLSKEAGRTRYYVDGQLAQENLLPEDALIAPGKALLGDWLQHAPDPYPKRSLKARIDEFAVWNRALTEEEIIAMTRAGSPSLLVLGEELERVKSPHYRALFHTSKRKAGE